MLLHLSKPQFLHLVNKNNNKIAPEGYRVDYNKSAHICFNCSINSHKLLLSCFEPLSLLKRIVWTSRTISLFRYSHDVITNPSKFGRTRPLKSFKGYSLSFDKPRRVWASFSWQDPCSPVMLMSPPMPCTPSTCFFLLGLWGALWYLELGRPESPGPGATWPSAQYDDPPGLHRASWQSGHSVSVCYVVSQITGTEAAGKNIL